METILIAAKALTEINLKQKTFAEFTSQLRDKQFQSLSGQAKREVRTFVSCALHKSEIIRFTLLQHGLDELQPMNQSIVNVYLCNRYFLKIVEIDAEALTTLTDGDEDRQKLKLPSNYRRG